MIVLVGTSTTTTSATALVNGNGTGGARPDEEAWTNGGSGGRSFYPVVLVRTG